MKPDSYMPFYGNDFFMAVSRLSDECAIAYLRAIWFYWHDNHCQGLNNNDDELRRICGKPDNWQEVKDELFLANGKFFSLREDGKWHQDRAQSEHNEAVRKYDARCSQTYNARKKRHA